MFANSRLLLGALLLDVPLKSLVDKATARALVDVPKFGLRKDSSSDILFAELIGEPLKDGADLRRLPSESQKVFTGTLATLLPTALASLYGQTRYFNLLRFISSADCLEESRMSLGMPFCISNRRKTKWRHRRKLTCSTILLGSSLMSILFVLFHRIDKVFVCDWNMMTQLLQRKRQRRIYQGFNITWSRRASW